MKIVGLDVCKRSVVACLISVRPSEPRQFYYDAKFETFPADAQGISRLLALKPDIAVMEPTGVNYSQLWGTHLARAGIEVRLVGHERLHSYRKDTLLLPDKDDEADALALACYCFDFLDSPRRFVQIRDEKIALIRQLVLRLAHLNRVQSPIINRLKQDLAWQFPEVMDYKGNRRSNNTPPLLWSWLAGEAKSKKYDAIHKKTCGLGVSRTVILHARRLCDLQREEVLIEKELRSLICDDARFAPYRKVCAKFGFGQRVEALILSQIFPLEGYLKDNKPDVIIRKGRVSGNPTKRHLSRRRFEKALGVAPTESSSGEKKGIKRVVGGSDLCRIALWQWVFTRIEPSRCRLNNKIGHALGDWIDEAKAKGQPVQLVRMKCASRAVRMLFYELVEALT